KEHPILSAQVHGTASDEGKSRVYRVTMDRTAIMKSYFGIQKEGIQVPLESVPLYDNWTHAADKNGMGEEYLMGCFGQPEYDSRRDGTDNDGSYVLRWEFGRGKDLSIQLKDKK